MKYRLLAALLCFLLPALAACDAKVRFMFNQWLERYVLSGWLRGKATSAVDAHRQ
jgi:hypothetical protein